ncbi:hypothetical protein HELRODRAFT_182397 [Helobdella robusta]|uniref:Uncharacterized protein n=1 Tax=Helobdella robusta TaxID=6412 RepID=T1FI49_HELRO|nr:hypothetical protein HELRODRAFT_182397 [Helobdella robusta]ESN91047.1 hypothetical protein HELRODRAFT_182397 [Helobdella robusta]
MIGTKLRACYPTVNGLMAWRVIVGRLLRRSMIYIYGLMAWSNIVRRCAQRFFERILSLMRCQDDRHKIKISIILTDGDSDEEVRDEELTKQTTLLSFFHPTQKSQDLNENEMEPEEESSNYIPPTTRGAVKRPIPTSSLGRKTKEGNNTIIFSCLKGTDELKKRVTFSLDNNTKLIDGYLVHKNIIINPSPKEQNRQMSVDIFKHILPFQDANCNRENIKKDPHPLLKSFMRRQNILNNACRNEEHCTCIRSFMEAYRIHKVSKPNVKKTKEYILIRPYCPTLITIYHKIHLAMIKNNIICNEKEITVAHKVQRNLGRNLFGRI